MKKFIKIIVLTFFMCLLISPKSIYSQENKYFDCVFSDNFNRTPETAWAAWWDPGKTYISDHAGSVGFTGEELIISAGARVPLIPVEGVSDRAVAFREGIFEFDLYWNYDNATNQYLRLDLGFLREPTLSFTNFIFYGNKVTVANNGTDAKDLTANVTSYNFEKQNWYRTKIYINRNEQTGLCDYKVYFAKLVSGEPVSYFVGGMGSKVSNLYNYEGGGIIRFVVPSTITQAVRIDNIKISARADVQEEISTLNEANIQIAFDKETGILQAAEKVSVKRRESTDLGEDKKVAIFLTTYHNNRLVSVNIMQKTLAAGEETTLDIKVPYPDIAYEDTLKSFVWDFTTHKPIQEDIETAVLDVYRNNDLYHEAREIVKNKNRRILYNNDGNDTYIANVDPTTVPDSEKTHENFLSKRTTGIEGKQVDSILYCTGVFNQYHHRSSGETEVRKKDWSWELADKGMDSLETIIDFGSKNNIEVFWSMRMNDCHDSAYQESELGEWKKAHLNLLMARKSQTSTLLYGNRYWSAVNYGEEEVRQKVFNIIKDVCTRYDVNGIELDFFRHPVLFKEVVLGETIYPQSIEKMNQLMRDIRSMTQEVGMKRKKPLLISVRIPDSKEYCYALGMDIETWMSENLIDMVVGGGYFRLQPWEYTVALCNQYNIPLYAGLSVDYLGSPVSSGLTTWKKEAAAAFAAGVKGMSTFNFVNPAANVFSTIGTMQTAGPVDAAYTPVLISPDGRGGPEKWVKDGLSYVRNYE